MISSLAFSAYSDVFECVGTSSDAFACDVLTSICTLIFSLISERSLALAHARFVLACLGLILELLWVILGDLDGLGRRKDARWLARLGLTSVKVFCPSRFRRKRIS